MRDGKAIGSELIAQPFTDPKYFWPRPSAANFDGAAGAASNLAPSNPALADAVRARTASLKTADPGNDLPIPIDLVTASASGLDPHISIAAARYQLRRVAAVRGMPLEQVQRLIELATEERTLGVLGEPRVNVLRLNLAPCDRQRPPKCPAAIQSERAEPAAQSQPIVPIPINSSPRFSATRRNSVAGG